MPAKPTTKNIPTARTKEVNAATSSKPNVSTSRSVKEILKDVRTSRKRKQAQDKLNAPPSKKFTYITEDSHDSVAYIGDDQDMDYVPLPAEINMEDEEQYATDEFETTVSQKRNKTEKQGKKRMLQKAKTPYTSTPLTQKAPPKKTAYVQNVQQGKQIQKKKLRIPTWVHDELNTTLHAATFKSTILRAPHKGSAGTNMKKNRAWDWVAGTL